MFPRSKHLCLLLESPVPGEPLEVFQVQQIEFVRVAAGFLRSLEPLLRIRSLSDVLLCSLNFEGSEISKRVFGYGYHFVKLDGAGHLFDQDLEGDSWVFFPEPILGLEYHAVEALELCPGFLLEGEEQPGPVEFLDAVEDLELV